VKRAVTAVNGATTVSGFTYVGLLIFISLMGAALAGGGIIHHQQARRAKEKDLLFIGEQFERAITAYFERSPGGAKRFPQALGDLLHDSRHPVPQRHLRRIYRDPMTAKAEWGLTRGPDNGITGVFSLSKETPIKTSGFPQKYADFNGSKTYAEWQFAYRPATQTAEASTNPDPPSPSTSEK
jgi:type II secretory pathway pseudopilin PulG